MGDRIDITANVDRYLEDAAPTARHRSFDYCFNHFRERYEQDQLALLREPPGRQAACLHLGFYLASWGMYRGSAALHKHSALALAPVIDEISTAPTDIWSADVTGYDDATRTLVLDVARRLKTAFPGGATATLVTKTMLGTFGCVPAFDSFFRRGARIHSFGPKSLRWLGSFAEEHADEIRRNQRTTLDFETGRPTDRCYTAAKVVDMALFIEGGGAGAL